MLRVACLMMQKDEGILLRPWLLYHGYLFGFENIYVFDNGSKSAAVLRIVEEFSAAGVKVEYTGGAQNKEAIISDKLRQFGELDLYDIALSADCHEFVSINGINGPASSRTDIFDELDRIFQHGADCRTKHGFANWPGYVDAFSFIEQRKVITVLKKFTDRQRDHDERPKAAAEYAETSLMYIKMAYRPLKHLVEAAKDELRAYVDISDPAALKYYSGPKHGLVKYLFMSEAQYYGHLDCRDFPMIRYSEFSRLLDVLTTADIFRNIWEAGRPAGLLDNLIEIDLDRYPFNANLYLQANADLSRAASDAFAHFVKAGYQEGRRLEASPKGLENALQRLADIRKKNLDCTIGYVGAAVTLSKLNRGSEADAIIKSGIAKFGERVELLREYGLSAMYQRLPREAMSRWETYRSRYPENRDGYRFGALSCREAGDLSQAEVLITQGHSMFPHDLGICLERAQIALDQSNLALAKQLFSDLLQQFPNDKETKQQVSGALFQIKLRELEADDAGDLTGMEGPVNVVMTEQECRSALDFLGLSSEEQMREQFMRLESLGYSCEVGLVQRRYGAEPIGLLRWNSIRFSSLIDALQHRFDGIDAPENLKLTRLGREYILRDSRYATAMHTFSYIDQIDPDSAFAQQVRRTAFLRRKMLLSLDEGEKIFVYLDDQDRSREQLDVLIQSFRACSTGNFLYVRVANRPALIGTVEEIAPGFVRGFIQRLGRDNIGTWNIAFDSWLSVCRGVRVLRFIS